MLGRFVEARLGKQGEGEAQGWAYAQTGPGLVHVTYSKWPGGTS